MKEFLSNKFWLLLVDCVEPSRWWTNWKRRWLKAVWSWTITAVTSSPSAGSISCLCCVQITLSSTHGWKAGNSKLIQLLNWCNRIKSRQFQYGTCQGHYSTIHLHKNTVNTTNENGFEQSNTNNRSLQVCIFLLLLTPYKVPLSFQDSRSEHTGSHCARFQNPFKVYKTVHTDSKWATPWNRPVTPSLCRSAPSPGDTQARSCRTTSSVRSSRRSMKRPWRPTVRRLSISCPATHQRTWNATWSRLCSGASSGPRTTTNVFWPETFFYRSSVFASVSEWVILHFFCNIFQILFNIWNVIWKSVLLQNVKVDRNIPRLCTISSFNPRLKKRRSVISCYYLIITWKEMYFHLIFIFLIKNKERN